MRKLILLTQEYPFGKGEGFLASELEFYSRQQQEVIIVPFKTVGQARKLPPGVSVFAGGSEKLAWVSVLTAVITKRWFWKELFRSGRYLFSTSARTAFFFFLKVAFTQRNRLLNLKVSGQCMPGDILYSYWLGGLTAGALLFNQRWSKAYTIVSRAHGGDVYENRYHPPYIPFRHLVLEYVNRVAVASHDGQVYLQQHYPEFSSKIHAHYLGTADPGFASQPSDDGVLRIVSCAYAKPVKRLHMIVDALAELQKNHPGKKVIWNHLGGGPLLEDVRKKSMTLQGSVSCYFSGDVSAEQIVSFYREHPVDVFVNVSSSEGLPVSIMEAMSVGIPVLATDVGGVRELVDDYCGKLVPADIGVRDLADALFSFTKTVPEVRSHAIAKWRKSFDQDENYALFLKTIMRL